MTRLFLHKDAKKIPRRSSGPIHVWLYGNTPPYAHAARVGSQVLELAHRLTVRPSPAAMDFLSIAMAITAADTFVLRGDADDAWSRNFDIVLPLAEPKRWKALQAPLEEALRFLSSDRWSFDFKPGGVKPPSLPAIRRKRDVYDLSKVDCVSLFSGGLDSAIGTLDLLGAKRRPLLVSHSPGGDAKKQVAVERRLPTECQRVSVNTYPTWSGADDDSMRTRSFQFVALGVLAAQAIAEFRGKKSIDLYVCENGFIALNPPLTPRRMGSHSTRTAHPHFLESMQELITAAKIPVRIVNPYVHKTKGEMAAVHAGTASFRAFAAETVSCGHWKRKNQQCGRCLPCLIRRAALHRAGIKDSTSYQSPNLQDVMKNPELRDDLVAVQSAIVREQSVERWVLKAGPLPAQPAARKAYFGVAERGLEELAVFLRAEGFAL
ncbi:MAG: hypothetical protein QOF14_5804 [Hyphomicrobiales bacterium]|jgi:hypothetical protein|nr:hypothetical protein [Hyphomicrobiales bacterium]